MGSTSQNIDNPDEILFTGITYHLSVPGVFKSSDGGATWNISGESDDSYPGINKFLQSGNQVIGWGIGGYDQVSSTDFGDHWSNDAITINGSGFNSIYAFEKHLTVETHLWLSVGNVYGDPQLLRSTDGGAEWVDFPGVSENDLYVHSIAPHPSDANIIYLVAGGNLLMATDGGESWLQNGLDRTTPLLSNVYWVAIDNKNPEHLMAGERDVLFVTSDGGATWVEFSTMIPSDLWMLVQYYDERLGQLFLGTSSGVYLYRN